MLPTGVVPNTASLEHPKSNGRRHPNWAPGASGVLGDASGWAGAAWSAASALVYRLRTQPISMAEAANSTGQPERGLQPLRDLCANLPEEFDAPQIAEAKRLLSQ